KTELDKDDGKYVYEVSFKKDGVEYDYEIDAASGKIIEFDSEKD
ncbi:MAG: PepSY domain-containing protein, partial [Clostridia bacterium]|nr:PepSY domain-containing protein [Clostridia bacterium]